MAPRSQLYSALTGNTTLLSTPVAASRAWTVQEPADAL